MGFKRKDVLTSALASGYTFTRTGTGSIASYFNSSGVLSYAAADVARFNHEYSGSAWVAKGLICEQAHTNNAIQSQAMHTSPWTTYGAGSLTANAAAFVDGTTTAERLDDGTATNAHGIATTSHPANPSGVVCISVFVKSETIPWANMGTLGRTATDGASERHRAFNLSTGETGLGNSTTQGTVNCANGWWRLWMESVSSASTQREFRLAGALANNNGIQSYLGANRTFIYSGAMLHAGSFPGTYIPTVGSAVTRGLDVCQITTPPVDTSLPFAMLIKYSLLPGASAGGPLVYEEIEGSGANSDSGETCKVVRFDGVGAMDYTEDGSVISLLNYTPGSVSLYLGNNSTSGALNGCISEVQWWQGAMSDATMLASAANEAFPNAPRSVIRKPLVTPLHRLIKRIN